MLVLSRKLSEAIIVNNDIRIVVTEIANGKVRIGIEAPKNVPVHREEVQNVINRNDRRLA